ncbi:MAG: ATP-binding protein [Nitrososphaerota archaeon]|nr:ATP-binding protein [Nitrososphaerota archaeon]MDG7037640.1 ATP-binding protein [Nitrososphaerota archaeon]
MDIYNALLRYRGYGAGLNMVKREIPLPEGNFINSIIGPRRAGKTFLMLLYKDMIDLPDSNKVFINGEDIDFEGIRPSDLDQIERAVFEIYAPDQRKDVYLFIDEVQNFPSWGRWVRTLSDEHRYRIMISGSTSDLSTDNLPNELRGRAINTLVLPFSFKEYCAARRIGHAGHMKIDEAGRLTSAFGDYLEYGGYPMVVEAGAPELKALILRELYETVLQRDLIEKYRIRRSPVLRAFINSLLGSACRVVSPATVSGWFGSHGIKLSAQTALNYLNYAHSVFLFFLVYPYSRKPKQRNTRPKLYLPDSGLLSLTDADVSKKLENQVFVELTRRGKRISYFNSGSSEVDFVVGNGRGVEELIQVSYSIEDPWTYARETRALVAASGALGCKRLTILTFNEERQLKVGRETITVTPAWKWMLS